MKIKKQSKEFMLVQDCLQAIADEEWAIRKFKGKIDARDKFIVNNLCKALDRMKR